MKACAIFITLALIGACKTSNTVSSSENAVEVSKNQEYCPENGNCSIKIHKNSSILLKKDTTGAYYPVIEQGEHMVVEFTFLEKGTEGTVDGDYSETVHFEINTATEILHLENQKLAQVKLLFGKHCFCRGEAGYYKVDKGNLILQKSKEEIVIDLSFVIDEVSHKIIRVKERISL